MAKRKEDAPPAGSPAWMATFSDLMNLLLCFFVMLFSMSTIDQEKLDAIVASMQQSSSFFNGGAKAIGDGILFSNGVSQLNELDEYINSTGKSADSNNDSDQFKEFEGKDSDTVSEAEKLAQAIRDQSLKENEELAELIREAVTESAMSDRIDVTFTDEYVQLSLRGAVLFDSGKAVIKDQALPVLNKVGLILEKYAEGIIEIEGHTDNVPISSSSKYAGNEELSSARAISVFHYLIDNTALEPSNIKYSGRGEYAPIADNSTEAGRIKNRRVEIRIYHTSSIAAIAEGTGE